MTRFASALLSSWFCFQILNQRRDRLQRGASASVSSQGDSTTQKDASQDDVAQTQQERRTNPEFAGQTLDLTLFAFIRAIDALGCIFWARWRACRKSRKKWSCVESTAPSAVDTISFVASCTVIMWAWFYHPGRLPRAYERWISDASQLDMRLMELLRRARRGEFVYGKDTGQAPLGQGMCKDYNLPMDYGDPVKSIPLPCELVHVGKGPSCEKHAAYRFVSTLKFACATYLPLQVALRLGKLKSKDQIFKTVSDAGRSSAFLASYVSIFYYSVCLARTRLGPKIFSRNTVTPLMWDSGLCVGAGCFLCGWSILIEKAHKRKELSLFVAPKAAAAILPRVYDRQVCVNQTRSICNWQGSYANNLIVPILGAYRVNLRFGCSGDLSSREAGSGQRRFR